MRISNCSLSSEKISLQKRGAGTFHQLWRFRREHIKERFEIGVLYVIDFEYRIRVFDQALIF